MNKNSITLLCRVVDNFGDIGFVFRLAKSITEKSPETKITLICSDLKSFSLMENKIQADMKIQTVEYKKSSWLVLDWNLCEDDLKELKSGKWNFDDNFPLILECFQCGRPLWLEEILFCNENNKIHHILNIEYLTAEDYAEDFHLLKSYTRSSNVKKVFFMPGFTPKTAGLVIDENFLILSKENHLKNENVFKISLFSYERDCTDIFDALTEFQEKIRAEVNKNFCVEVYAAQGKSLSFAQDAWNKTGKKISFFPQKFMSQTEYDKLLLSMDINFVRGEETLARACLCSKPFLWQAYIQDENYQLVKVNALLDRIRKFFPEESWICIKKLFLDYNTPHSRLQKENLLFLFGETYSGKLTENFKGFSDELFSQGELTENLLDYIEQLP